MQDKTRSFQAQGKGQRLLRPDPSFHKGIKCCPHPLVAWKDDRAKEFEAALGEVDVHAGLLRVQVCEGALRQGE